MNPDARPGVSFGPFIFDPATGELLRDGRPVRLQRQPARLLELLLANAGQLVSRDEIRQALWGDDVHVDFERSLNFCVGRLRGALEDDPSAPRFVETVPTRGYRFIAATAAEKRATEYTEYTEYAEAGGSVVGRVFRAGILKWIVAAVVLVGAGAGFFAGLHRTPTGTPKIVVIPFHNETGSPDFDRIAKGISDAAVAQLATPERITRLRVIGNATDVHFSFRPRDMKAMGQALGAQYLLLGQVKKDDHHTRVIAHLIRVSDQTHIWANTFDRDTLDLPAQAAIAEDIAKAVSAHI